MKAANQSGSVMVGKEIEQIADKLDRDVFECSYAKEKGGCGKLVHCKTCAIRNIVMDTLSSNNGYVNVPAFQNIMTSDGPKIMKFIRSTEIVGECILLRIDQISKSQDFFSLRIRKLKTPKSGPGNRHHANHFTAIEPIIAAISSTPKAVVA